MNLPEFMPYRLAAATDAVSRALAGVYADRFELTRDEWRVLAQLADVRELKATELGLRAALPKMQVSRALTRLEEAGLIAREPHPGDRRNLLVRLTAQGRALYRKIEPLVLARTADLLDALDAEERRVLTRALAKLEERALRLPAAP